MAALLSLHLIAAVIALAAGPRLGRWALVVAAAPPTAALVWLASQAADVLDGQVVSQRMGWLDELDVSFSFGLDGFALLMGLIVAGMGALILGYAASYFDASTSPRYLARFAGYFVAFAGAMLGLVLADDLWTMLVFWEATSVTSFLLIGLDDESAGARAAALRALLVTGAGGLALLGGVALLGVTTGTTSFAALAADPPSGAAIEASLVLLLLGAFTKSAQVPFHFWLPGAMAAPTPVSAYLHSATMVKAGVVLVARLAPVFAFIAWWRPLLVTVGCLTMLVGGLRALRQVDAKLLLAHGTVSQLGLLVVLLGAGFPAVTAAGVAMLAAHALFKAALFLVTGIVDHATGSRDIRCVSGVGAALPWLAGLAAVAAASMAGVVPLFGFVAKEAALDALLDASGPWGVVALVGVCVGSVLTVAYTLRWFVGMFGTRRAAPVNGALVHVHHPPSGWFVTPVVLLAGLTAVAGLVPSVAEGLFDAAAQSLDEASHAHLVLWGGVHLPLLLSAAILLGGLALHVALSRAPAFSTAAWPSGERCYQALLDGLLRGSLRVTAVSQTGSLPAYVGSVFTVVVAAVAAAFLVGASPGDRELVLASSPLQAVVAAAAAGAALAAVLAGRRFVSVLLLGAVGYGMAVLFVLYGAPDLALTQFLVETLSLVVFLLVLRHLPPRYAAPPAWAPRALRLGIALAVGVGVSAFALVAGTSRSATPIAEEVIARSEPEGGGLNVVNVILVDIRGIDTLGEITVLAVAVVGVANLVGAARRAERERRLRSLGELGLPLDTAADDVAGPQIGARSIVLDQVTRIMFHLILLVSVYVTYKGHNAPGGGFAGGLIAGAAFALRFLAGGQPRLRRSIAVPPVGLVGTGLLLAVGTGLGGLAAGNQFLESTIAKPHLPLTGELKLVSSTVFDTGVYLLVLGVVLTLLANLGAGSGEVSRSRSATGATLPDTATEARSA
ncbi:MAG: Na+/H+ antiporter subunit A [Acidimicrobiia bacterium]|nr:Na+/H+ antiporter subunit A [Acidimicrobiia bacterium]